VEQFLADDVQITHSVYASLHQIWFELYTLASSVAIFFNGKLTVTLHMLYKLNLHDELWSAKSHLFATTTGANIGFGEIDIQIHLHVMYVLFSLFKIKSPIYLLPVRQNRVLLLS
jgi:hypothetical protein